MMGLKLVLLFGCLALVTCRTVTIQKTSLSVTEDSEDINDISDILQTFLGYSGDISSLQNGDVGGCSKGKCQFCKKIMKKNNACFIATLGKSSITVEVTLNGKDVMKKDIKVIYDYAQVKDINLKKASGCVFISFKVGFKKISVKIACFTIPHDDVIIGGKDDVTVDVDLEENAIVESIEQNSESDDKEVDAEANDVESFDLEVRTLKFQPFSRH